GRILHVDGFPSTADLFYLGLYPAIAAGLDVLILRPSARAGRSTLVHTTTLTTRLGLLCWVFLIHPAASDPSIGLLGHVTRAAYTGHARRRRALRHAGAAGEPGPTRPAWLHLTGRAGHPRGPDLAGPGHGRRGHRHRLRRAVPARRHAARAAPAPGRGPGPP